MFLQCARTCVHALPRLRQPMVERPTRPDHDQTAWGRAWSSNPGLPDHGQAAKGRAWSSGPGPPGALLAYATLGLVRQLRPRSPLAQVSRTCAATDPGRAARVRPRARLTMVRRLGAELGQARPRRRTCRLTMAGRLGSGLGRAGLGCLTRPRAARPRLGQVALPFQASRKRVANDRVTVATHPKNGLGPARPWSGGSGPGLVKRAGSAKGRRANGSSA